MEGLICIQFVLLFESVFRVRMKTKSIKNDKFWGNSHFFVSFVQSSS